MMQPRRSSGWWTQGRFRLRVATSKRLWETLAVTKEGERRAAQVVVQPGVRLEHDLLHHVAGVDPADQGVVEPQPDHPPQGTAVLLPEAFHRAGVVLFDAPQ